MDLADQCTLHILNRALAQCMEEEALVRLQVWVDLEAWVAQEDQCMPLNLNLVPVLCNLREETLVLCPGEWQDLMGQCAHLILNPVQVPYTAALALRMEVQVLVLYTLALRAEGDPPKAWVPQDQ